jgi:hypothetical protein
MKNKILFIAIIILFFQLAMQVYLAKTDSQTTDEAVHLSAGYTYLVNQSQLISIEFQPKAEFLVDHA